MEILPEGRVLPLAGGSTDLLGLVQVAMTWPGGAGMSPGVQGGLRRSILGGVFGNLDIFILFFYFLSFFKGCTCGIQKFLG